MDTEQRDWKNHKSDSPKAELLFGELRQSTTPKAQSSKPSRAELLFGELRQSTTPKAQSSKPQEGLDSEVEKIYRQAHQHRSSLVRFYVWYTSLLSLVIVSIIFLQANVRLIDGNEDMDLIPQAALNLLVFGMFGQFIGLLTIVTKKVWTYEPFLAYQRNNKVDE